MEGAPETVPFRWNRWECAGRPLNLGVTLRSGQSFRWRQDTQGLWWGVVGRCALALWQAESAPESPLLWQTFPEPDNAALLADYFQFGIDLDALIAAWTAAEPRLADTFATYRGLRVLRQPPEECLFGFLCATTKPIPQIERLVWELAARYGEPLGAGQEASPLPLYVFPTLDALAGASEADIRAMGWGFRAPRVIVNARELRAQPEGWLESLRNVPYAEARAALLRLSGVGPKIADCVCLFALDKREATPVDRHIHRLGCELFRPELAGKSLTPTVYDALGAAYRDCFGAYAGWAQQYHFFTQIRRAVLPEISGPS